MHYPGFGMPIYASSDDNSATERDDDETLPGSGEKAAATAAAMATKHAGGTVSTGVAGVKVAESKRRDKWGGTAAAAWRKRHVFGDLFVKISVTLPAGERFG